MLLSICIATCNRSEKLARTLAALQTEIADLQNTVEIVVGDNHSDDDTPAVVKRFGVVSVRHARNIGPEENYRAIVERARGKYVWLLADDDYLREGCVRALINRRLAGRAVGYVFVNYRLLDEATGRQMPSACPVEADAEINGADDLFLKTHFAGSFIGSNVYLRSAWVECMNPAYFKTAWGQMYMACAILRNYRGYVIAEPLVMMGALPVLQSRAEKAKQGKPTYYMDAHRDYLRFARWLRLGGQAGAGLANQILGMNLAQILYHKVTAPYGFLHLLRTFADMVRLPVLRNSLRFWLVDTPALFLPRRA